MGVVFAELNLRFVPQTMAVATSLMSDPRSFQAFI